MWKFPKLLKVLFELFQVSFDGSIISSQDKTKIVHFRQQSVARSAFTFKHGSTVLSYADQYKYLDFILDEHLTFN